RKEKKTDQPAAAPPKEPTGTQAPATAPGDQNSESAPSAPVAAGRVKASPLAKKVAAELGVDLDTLQGSGPGGRIVREDVLASGKSTTSAPASPPKPDAV